MERRDKMAYFMYFVLYSFIGFILETLYTLITRGILISKKCFLINLLCPVYGLGAIAILACTKPIKQYKILTFVIGGAAATAVEYLLDFIYKEILGVSIWDYSGLPYNINGRVCLLFTIFWSILSMGLVYFIHPFIEKRMATMPKTLFAILLLFVGMDAMISTLLYKKFGNRQAVNLTWLISNYHNKIG